MLIEHEDYLVFPCPHCLELVLVMKKELNCQIFRHGFYKDTFTQVSPHLPKKLCEYLTREDKVYGCSKPFQVLYNNNEYKVQICDYI
jgi:hypothetical protein